MSTLTIICMGIQFVCLVAIAILYFKNRRTVKGLADYELMRTKLESSERHCEHLRDELRFSERKLSDCVKVRDELMRKELLNIDIKSMKDLRARLEETMKLGNENLGGRVKAVEVGYTHYSSNLWCNVIMEV